MARQSRQQRIEDETVRLLAARMNSWLEYWGNVREGELMTLMLVGRDGEAAVLLKTSAAQNASDRGL